MREPRRKPLLSIFDRALVDDLEREPKPQPDDAADTQDELREEHQPAP